MKLSGTNTLYTPRIGQVNFLFQDIVVDNTGVYAFSSSQYQSTSGTGSALTLFNLSGGRLLDPSGRFLASYNTGENFDVNGWLDFSNGWRYLGVGSIISRTVDPTVSSGLLGEITIVCPNGGTLTCDIKLTSSYVAASVSFQNVQAGGFATGTITTTHDMYVSGGINRFYKSYESLLTGGEFVTFVPANTPTNLIYGDNDTSYQNNSLTFDHHISTTYADVISEVNILRSGIYSTGITQAVLLGTQSGFSGLFDGIWSGSGFYYDDSSNPTNSLTFDYLLAVLDVNGNAYPSTVTYSHGIYDNNTVKRAEYITGFRLDATGEYLEIPQVAVTGYYYITGLQQNLMTLLFSSGCTGNLNVSFASDNGAGAGASGQLVLTSVNFSGVYGVGVNPFKLVSGYRVLNQGTGYTMAPRATVNTGQYGASCYDLPNTSGYNYSWYKPFNTSGTLNVEAGWFTGIALCRTGLVSGGALTGYTVTGIDVYNIGTGYSNDRLPLMSFVRVDTVSGLTQNASGTLLMKTGQLFTIGTGWKIETGVAGGTLVTGVWGGGSVMLAGTDQYFSIRVTADTGVNITDPISGYMTVNYTGHSITTVYTFSKYLPTGADALKKKDDELVVYDINTDLGYNLSQNALDTLYSSASYTNNSWPYNEGDFDF